MQSFALRRVALALVVLVVLAAITFLMAQVIPGDPARTAAGRTASPEAVEAARERLGLDKPVPAQFVDYVGRLVQGDLGTSAFTHRPIADDLAEAIPPSIELVLAAMLINVLVAVPLGVLGAVRRGTWVDALSRVLVVMGSAVPVFWVALMLQLIFAVELGWLPITGQFGADIDPGSRITGFVVLDSLLQGNLAAAWSGITHLILPAIALAVSFMAIIARTVRSSMLSVLERDYITLARAKGLTERRVLSHHAMRNALLPATTIVGMQFGWMLGSTVLVETIFGRAGLGAYAVNAVLQSDLLAVVGVVLVVGLFFVLANLVVDLLYVRLNPRLRLA
jgi:ABC-type dipeptide/oligopeptide/nickel transport system permease component